jgi:superfamily II DNA/RNA helicase
LIGRVVPRVRCVVLVPTRDLVLQVKDVFKQLTRNTDLKVTQSLRNSFNDRTLSHLIYLNSFILVILGTVLVKIAAIFGEKSFKEEQLALVSDTVDSLYAFKNEIKSKKSIHFN